MRMLGCTTWHMRIGFKRHQTPLKKRLLLSLQTVGYDAGDPDPGQGRAAAICSSAERTLDAVEGQYAESWLLVRHFAPTAMMAGCGFLPTNISCSIKLREH